MDGFNMGGYGGMDYGSRKRQRSPEPPGDSKAQRMELFPGLTEQQVEGLLSIIHRGRLRSYQYADGYGFIECQGLKMYGYERDVFVHYKELPQQIPPCGTALSFMIRKNPKGLIQAANVTIIPEEQATDLARTEVKVETPIQEQVYMGVVKSFTQGSGPDGKGGFGFIKCDDTERLYERDVFLHRNQLTEGPNTPRDFVVGMKLTFQVQLNARNMPQARNVKILEDQPPEVKQQMMLLMTNQNYKRTTDKPELQSRPSFGQTPRPGEPAYRSSVPQGGTPQYASTATGSATSGYIDNPGGYTPQPVQNAPPPTPLLGIEGNLEPAVLAQLSAITRTGGDDVSSSPAIATLLNNLAAGVPAPPAYTPNPVPKNQPTVSSALDARALASLAQSGLL
eukprot:TRINITY_DN14340_c0_g1_i1.p1 TRINITY_DN14340_c0_g1~~TRINITY_DN14340_c0_g1_i1.p1  ORF type:complete len:394 (+),score=46.97 TRINITY_DN14340_c0_g1_i1:77-1258(+)